MILPCDTETLIRMYTQRCEQKGIDCSHDHLATLNEVLTDAQFVHYPATLAHKIDQNIIYNEISPKEANFMVRKVAQAARKKPGNLNRDALLLYYKTIQGIAQEGTQYWIKKGKNTIGKHVYKSVHLYLHRLGFIQESERPIRRRDAILAQQNDPRITKRIKDWPVDLNILATLIDPVTARQLYGCIKEYFHLSSVEYPTNNQALEYYKIMQDPQQKRDLHTYFYDIGMVPTKKPSRKHP